MKILVLADLGQPVYHVGDEAMGIAAADELIARGHEVIFATRNPEHSLQMIGTGIDYVHTLEFPWPPAEREAYLDELERFLFHQERTEPADEKQRRLEQLVEDISRADAVVIAGGGNMNSRYGWLLYERAALGMVARFLEKPLVISGQSVGPVLTERDSHTLTHLLKSAQLVGMREESSQAWCAERGITTVAGIDDAVFYAPGQRHVPGEDADMVFAEDFPAEYLSVTLNGLTAEQMKEVAALLDKISEKTGLASVFVPHMGNPEIQDGDVATHRGVAEQMRSHAVVLPILHADTATKIHRGAAAVLTTRYHPAVLAMVQGVPALGLLPDAFTDMRLGGALAHFGLQDFAIPLALLGADSTESACFELLNRRAEISKKLVERGELLRGFKNRWWDAVAQVCAGQKVNLAGVDCVEPVEVPESCSDWRELNAPVRQAFSALSLQAHQMEAEYDRAQTWDAWHTRERDEFRENYEGLARARLYGVRGVLRKAQIARSAGLTGLRKKLSRRPR